ncbi:hypothetical protein SDC9_124561 [bioreactor metagenome]|uniref:Uncharacterized protein n=1 Tax=bioreactor metagenome TaxID=1076179 RepID=A0A645CKU1_9ZZZZ
MADLHQTEIAVRGQVKVVGAGQPLVSVGHQLAADAVCGKVNPHLTVSDLLVGVGGTGGVGTPRCNGFTCFKSTVRVIGRTSGIHVRQRVTGSHGADGQQRRGCRAVTVQCAFVVPVATVENQRSRFIRAGFGVQLIDSHQPVHVPVAVVVGVNLIHRGRS